MDSDVAPTQAPIEGLTDEQVKFYEAMLGHVEEDYRALARRAQKIQQQLMGLKLTANGLYRLLGQQPEEDLSFIPSFSREHKQRGHKR